MRILVIAGESSGDIHGANLVRELKRISPNIEIYAAGGENIKNAGAVLLVDMVKHAVIGAVEVLKHYAEFKKIFHSLTLFLDKEKPDAVVLIDYPGFNLRFAAAAKERGIKVIYYISPQIWAWAPGRIHKIKKIVDKMIVILPFEKEIYEKAGVPVDYVGHPILDVLKEETGEEVFRKKLNIKQDDIIVGLLPGSRENEIKKILPAMLGAADILSRENKRIRFLISSSNNTRKYIESVKIPPKLNNIELSDDVYNIMKCSCVCMVASGTVTVQAAFYMVPMVIIYKVAFITWFLGRMLINIPYIGLVNVIAGRKIIDEFIQFDAVAGKIALKVRDIITDEKVHSTIKRELLIVKERLGQPGASVRAAQVVIKCLGNK